VAFGASLVRVGLARSPTLVSLPARRWRIYHEVMNLGMPEMIFIFLLALVIFGPRKLPELGRQLGKALAEFKRASNEFKNQLETEMMNIELEERAKKIPDSIDADGRTILPVEQLYQTTSAPAGSISRGYLDQPPELPAAEPASPEAGKRASIDAEDRSNSDAASSNG
jgi:TatA/E family protein of Tat protein translocase